MQPGADIGGIGVGLVRMVRPWNEWLIVWGYDIDEQPPVVDEAVATQIVRNLVGAPDLDVKITGTSLWGNNEMYATHLQSAGCSAWATRSTGTRRATASAPTPRSRTPTTWPGSSPRCCAARPRRHCWTPTPPSARRSAEQIVERANKSAASSGRSSTRSG